MGWEATVIHTPAPNPGLSPQRGSISDPATTEDNSANCQTWDRFHPTADQPPGGLNFQRYPGNSRNPYPEVVGYLAT